MEFAEKIEKLKTWRGFEFDEDKIFLGEIAKDLETLLSERDAALSMLKGDCHACKHNSGWHNVGKCKDCVHETAQLYSTSRGRFDLWEWKGA